MKLSTECLEASQVDSLLQGNLTPEEYESAQNHLELCETCRARVEATIGPEQWWSDVQSVLLNSRTGAFSQRNASSTDAEPNEPSTAKLLDLLGPTDDPNMLGRIGSYEIIGLLGQGGMGAVFKGFDRSLNRFVAIKMLLPHLAASGAARKRFAREGQAVAAVVDDHVMAIHCVDEWQGVPYLVMTYSRGVSLQKRLSENGPLEVREILRIGMQAAKGLAAAHAQGIVHRDIKPANIFLDQTVERVQLMDFGLARAVDDASLTRSGTLAGTPQYMSPEQARAETVDHRSDLFSLGSVMYAMCTGHAPFRGESSYSVLRLITDKESRPIREINPNIPEWLCSVISRLMAKQADDRFTSAQEVAELLEDCLAHVQQPTSSPLPGSLVPHVATVRRSVSNVTRTGVMTMLGTLGISLLGMFLWQATDPPDISGQWTSDEWGTVVLKAKEPGQYEGTFNGSGKVGPANDVENNTSNKVPDEGASRTSTTQSAVEAIPPGKLHLKWSAIERRFNGNWGTGDDTKGKISLRLVDNEIRGACTSTSESRKKSTSPQLTDLLWKRRGGTSTSIVAAAEKEDQSTMPAEPDTFLDRLQGTWRTKGEPMVVWEVFMHRITETVFDATGNVRSEEWLISDEGNLDNLASPARIKLMAKDRTTGSFPLGGAITQRCLLAVDGDSLVCCTGADYPNEIAKRPGQFVREFRRDKENPLELRGDWIVDDWDRGSGDDAILKSNDIDFPRYSLRFHPDRFWLRALNDKYVESPEQPMIGFGDVREFQWSIPGESQPGEFLLTVQSGNKTQLLYGRYQSMHTPPRTKPDRLRLTISRKPLTSDSPSASDWHFECHRARTEIEREQKLEALPESQSQSIAVRTLNVQDPRSVVLEFLHQALHKQYQRAAELCLDKLVEDGWSVSDDVENEFSPYRSVRRLSLKSLYIDLESKPKAALFFTRRETLSDWDRPVCLAIHLTRTEHGWVITRCESVDEQQEQEMVKAFAGGPEGVGFDLWEDDDLNPNSQWSEFSRKYLSPGQAETEVPTASGEESNEANIDKRKTDYADIQGDWIIDSLYYDDDCNSRELQRQAGGSVFLGAIKVEANELYFRNPPVAGMSRISGAISLKPVEGNDPRLFQVVDSRITGGEIKFGMYKVVGDKLTILLTQDAPPKLLAPTEGEFYFECHRPASDLDQAMLNAIDMNPDQIKVMDGKPKDAEHPVPAKEETTAPGNVSGTEEPGTETTDKAGNTSTQDEEDVQWGPAGQNGLQAGVRFNPSQTTYVVGQPIKLEFFFRTVDGRSLEGSLPNVFDFDGVEARDTTGESIPALHTPSEVVGGWMSVRFSDKPMSRTYKKLTIVAETNDELKNAENLASAISSDSSVVRAHPGTDCRVRFTVPNFANGADGTLQTGEVAFRVNEALKGSNPTN